MNDNATSTPISASAQNANPLIEIGVTLIIPSLILMKLSGAENLGPVNALLLALAFPLAWGARDFFASRKLNLLATVGLVSILLTGGIGLLQLDAKWLAVKEAAIPALLGLAVVASTRTRYPLIKTLLYNPAVIDVARVHERLEARGNLRVFESRLARATWMLGGTFLFSAVMNYVLATWIVKSPAGTPAFNEELGRLTLVSYPVIALPSMLMMMFILYYLSRVIRDLTGLKFTDLFHTTKG